MHRRLMMAAASAAAIGATALAAAPGAMAAPHIGACQLHGTANFNNPLFGGPTAGSFTYSFNGTLSNCQSSVGGPSGGKIAAGLNGLPGATGSGSCASSTTSGTSVINWSDGKTTVVSYTTTGAAAAVGLTGNVVASVQQQTGVDPVTGQPTYTTVKTTEPATPVGDYAGGLLAFQPPDPTACAPGGAGVSSAGIDGLIGTGDYQ